MTAPQTVADVQIDRSVMADRFMALLQGQKNECPVCAKRVIYQSYQTLSGSGIGQHIRSAHPVYADMLFAVAKKRKKADAAKAKAAEAEAKARPLRMHSVSGAFLDEIVGELRGLIGMMEPYYVQGDCADITMLLIERIEKMQDDAALRAAATSARQGETK